MGVTAGVPVAGGGAGGASGEVVAAASTATVAAPAVSQAFKAVAGGISGTVCSLVCSPLDVARTRAMVERTTLAAGAASGGSLNGMYTGVVAPLRHIYTQEGVRGWFRGLVPSLVNVPVFWSLYFPMYDAAKQAVRSSGWDLPETMEHLAGAVSAGAVCDLITNPLWVLRTRLQTHNMYAAPGKGVRALGVLECARGILRHEGALAYYKGLGASLLGLSHVAIQFPLYEHFKKKCGERPGRRDGPLSTGEIVASSMGSKAIASTLTYPHEVLRARLQHQVTAVGRGRGGSSPGAAPRPRAYTGITDAVRQIIREEGIAGMYRGLSLNLVRTLPAVAVTFTTYEKIVQELPKLGIGAAER
eukprot:PRCOL_00001123-RA